MGREVKRVPIDFDHPVDEVWPGYVPPDVRDCPDCFNGYTDERDLLESMMLRLLGFVNRIGKRGLGYGADNLIISKPDRRELTEEFAEFTEGLTGRETGIMGHDAIDRWKATKTVIEAAGLDPETWGICDTCDGSAIHPDDQDERDDWERTDPPKGEGWQVWENVSEGSPITPVFETKGALIEHLCTEGTEWDEPFSQEAAINFVDAEWAPSFVASSEGVQSGVEATR